MEETTARKLLIHLETGKICKILGDTLLKSGRDKTWKDAVTYQVLNGDGKTFTRLKDEFDKKFKEIDIREDQLV